MVSPLSLYVAASKNCHLSVSGLDFKKQLFIHSSSFANVLFEHFFNPCDLDPVFNK